MSIDLEALYIDLHRHPELSFQETRTAGVIARELAGLGLDHIEGVGKTGIATSITGAKATSGTGAAPVIWLRADMDALPVEEQTGLPYASTARGIDPAGTDVPVMHACGHDMHVTAMLGALERLAATRDEWAGTVVAVFQPAEEYGAGAQAMIADGVLDAFPKPDIVLGQHLTPLPAGVVGVRPGTQMAASDGLRVRLLGRGGHGSRPHATIDPVVMAAATVMRLQTIVSREIDPREMAVVTVGAIHAGEAPNVIPDRAQMRLSVRALKPEVRDLLETRIKEVVHAQAAVFGATATIDYQRRYPVLVNDAEMTAFARNVAREWVGDANLIDGMVPLTGSEDFAFLLEKRPGCYLIIGNGDGEGGCMVHNPGYDFNDAALPTGASYWVKLAETFLV